MPITRWTLAATSIVAIAATAAPQFAPKAKLKTDAPELASVTARSVSFAASHTIPRPSDRAHPPPALKMSVVAQRPALLHIAATSSPIVKSSQDASKVSFEFHGAVFDVFNSDGVIEVEVARLLNKFHRKPAPAKLEDIGHASELPRDAQTPFIFGKFLSDFHRVGVTVVNGKRAIVYSTGNKAPRSSEEYRMYVDPRRKLPLRISRFDSDTSGRQFETERTDYSNWKLNAPIPASTFRLDLPPGAKPADEDGR